MKCSEAKRWISARVDSQLLDERLRRRLDEHLKACPSCRQVLAAESERARLIESSLGGARDPRPLAGRILEAAKRADARGERIEPLFPWMLQRFRPAFGAAAFVAVGVLAGFWAFRLVAPPLDEPAQAHAAGSLLFLEDRSSTSDVILTEDGAPIVRDMERSRLTIEPPAPETRPGVHVEPHFWIDVETENTKYFRFADYR